MITAGRSKVLVNRKLTRLFPLERRVRQGCNVNLLLFALSTQPSMKILRRGTERKFARRRSAKRKNPTTQIFVRMIVEFLSATEHNFDALKKEEFETIYRAKLHLAKSVVIPMVLPHIPHWLERSESQ
ncbi:hypothetical protein R1flu_014162 [Riccia fluitans]|uniref:Uncharacterized protein n=1 Tax=Riccia fluitans TaxID=41844 RepID=A0ABD1YFB8_9MARC